MNKSDVIYVAGHRGLVGSAICRLLERQGYTNVIHRSSKDLDLRDKKAVESFFEKEKPAYVFMAAGKVGGLFANKTYPVEFLEENALMAMNTMGAAHRNGVKKFLYLASSCIFPRECPQPMKEEYFLTGHFESTNEGYAVAKALGVKLGQMYKTQYQFNVVSVMPSNLFGVGDNFDLESSHVLPAFINRFHQAKVDGVPKLVLRGTGSALREWTYVDDLADACYFVMKNYDGLDFLNVGTGYELSIKQLAEAVKEAVEYTGDIGFDPSYPDGMPRKLMDNSKIQAMGWKPKVDFKQALKLTYEYYKSTLTSK